MKTLLISGVVWTDSRDKELIHYNVTLYGQTEENPEVEYIKAISVPTKIGYNALIRKCKEVYCEYFETDENNIITLDHITRIENTPAYQQLHKSM